ncbi:MAG: TIGR04086 family membrane protein [Dethiobacter sp.]|nr:TIGR04086 family membrane protein [Dethiobacter sp.]MCL5982975.1 TIGR04086 family membrane protein [Bacillota bacterium]
MPKRSAVAIKLKTPATAIIMAKGVLYAYFISLVVFLIFSALIQHTRLTEGILPYIAYATSLVAIFVAAAYVARRLETKGWLNGGITGLAYLVGLVVFAVILLPDFQVHLGYLSKAFLAFVAGAAGGIFGLNS